MMHGLLSDKMATIKTTNTHTTFKEAHASRTIKHHHVSMPGVHEAKDKTRHICFNINFILHVFSGNIYLNISSSTF